MTLESIFKNSNDCYFFVPGLDKSYLLNQLEFAPVWLPEDYIKSVSYTHLTLPTIYSV